jgi:methionyl-tRNA formyltransferase
MYNPNSDGFRILLYLGRERYCGVSYCEEALIDAILASQHQLTALLIEEDDALALYAVKKGITVIKLLPELCKPKSSIQASLKSPSFQKKWQNWLTLLKLLKFDVGLVFYGYWLPSELFTLPQKGFVNFHPSPLPKLRGFEPETFAILHEWKEFWGTYHYVTEEFDEGEILWKTATIPIKIQDTPEVLIEKLAWEAIFALKPFLDALFAGTILPQKQNLQEVSFASTKKAIEESCIDWDNDDLEKILLRYRAFHGQLHSFALKAEIDQQFYQVLAIKPIAYSFQGNPGDFLGYYEGEQNFAGNPMFRVKNGAVVLKLSKNSLTKAEFNQISSPKQEKRLFNKSVK